MSSKSRQVNLPKPTNTVPRALEVVQKDFQEAAFNLGQVQYQIFVAEKQAAELKELILNLNQEGAARKALDAEAESK